MTPTDGGNTLEVRGSIGPWGSVQTGSSVHSMRAFSSIDPPLAKASTHSARAD